MKWYLVALCFVAEITSIDNANILGVFPFPGKSHFVMFESVLKGLAKKGHQVDVLSHFPLKEPLEGYTDLNLQGTQQVFTNNMSVDLFGGVNRAAMLYMMMTLAGTEMCEATFKSDVTRNLLNTTKKYDVVLVEVFTTDCMLGFGHHFGVPTVAMSSSVVLPWYNDRFGNPDNPSYIPSFEASYSPKMTLYERVVNTYYVITANMFYYVFSERPVERMAREFFGEDMPRLRDLTHNISLLLVNSHVSTTQARPTVPNFVEVGGVHITPKPLDKHFQDILATDTKGIIYLTMGSMVLTESFLVAKIQGMFDAFAELPYKVVWKANKNKFPKEVRFPDNIHFEKWMPQLDILCHPNVKLFVTHGGLMGNQEATYCGVPLLGIPLFGDQKMNIKQSVNRGVALTVAYDDITKESILEAATKLLNDPKYQATAKEISQRFKDRPMSPLDTALYWIEYVIRHKGAPHLRSVGADLPWYQYHLLDVAVILVVGPLVVVYLSLCIVKYLFAAFGRSGKSKKD